MVAAYPEKARAARIGGHVALRCDFRDDGRLRRCETVAEEPLKMGFGRAAKALAEKFQANPATADGKGLGGASVQVPVSFAPDMLDPATVDAGQPKWAGAPTYADVDAAFQALPRDLGPIRVVLGCTVRQGGSLAGCSVESENPPGRGAGAAALTLVPKFRMTTWSAEGLPIVGSKVRVPIRYEAPASPAAAKGP